jgi:hypothetical protein
MYTVSFTITSALPADLGYIPISAEIDFASLLPNGGSDARLKPASIVVIDLADDTVVPHHLTEDFAHGDHGRVEFVIGDPTHTRYDIRFSSLASGETRPPWRHRGPFPLSVSATCYVSTPTNHGPLPCSASASSI